MKKIVATILCLVLALSMTACAAQPTTPGAPANTDAAPKATEPAQGTSDAGKPEPSAGFDPASYKIGFACFLKNHPVHRLVQFGFFKAAKDLGYSNAKLVGTEGTDMNEVYGLVEAFVAEGGNALGLWYLDESCYPSLKMLGNAGLVTGIPHFKFDPMPEGLTFGMACNPTAYGTAAADFIAERIQGKTGTIAVTQNNKNVTENAATEAFAKRMAELNLPGVKVLPVELQTADVAAGTNIAAAIIQKNSDLIAAFATMGEGPVTWAAAANKSGKAPGEIVIVSMDYTEANLDLVEKGEVAAIIAQPLYEEAYKTMEYIDTILRGGTVPPWTDLEAPIVYKGGEGSNSPSYYRQIYEDMKTWFGEK